MHHCFSCEPCLPLRKYFISQKPLLQIALSFTKDLGHVPGQDTFPLLISGLICLHFYFSSASVAYLFIRLCVL